VPQDKYGREIIEEVISPKAVRYHDRRGTICVGLEKPDMVAALAAFNDSPPPRFQATAESATPESELLIAAIESLPPGQLKRLKAALAK